MPTNTARENLNEQSLFDELIVPLCETAKQTLPYFTIDEVTWETSLYGTDHALLDSMNLVTFALLLEEEIEKRWQVAIKISTEDLVRPQGNPFADLRSLARFVLEKVTAA